jgi:hypothetical protein
MLMGDSGISSRCVATGSSMAPTSSATTATIQIATTVLPRAASKGIADDAHSGRHALDGATSSVPRFSVRQIAAGQTRDRVADRG